jgi:thioredoxin-like negative regulator of GroEL
MNEAAAGWERRLANLWAEIDEYGEEEFVSRVEALAAELPSGSAAALFERASAFDSTGQPDRAVPLYASALDAGLVGERRRRAVIQMASSLRNLGKPEDALRLLTVEAAATSDDLDGAVAAFLALALVDVGREREAAAAALTALSKCLPRYNRSVARYAQALTDNLKQ